MCSSDLADAVVDEGARLAPAPIAVPPVQSDGTQVGSAARMVVRVRPDQPAIDRHFDYTVPTPLVEQIRVGTMVRIPPERGKGTRLELGIGDGAGNPYVVIAAVLAAALDGIRRNLTPPDALEGWTYEDPAAEVLPMSLEAALEALSADDVLREMLGKTFVDTFVTLKADEVARYNAAVADPATREVTDWEIEEYLQDY